LLLVGVQPARGDGLNNGGFENVDAKAKPVGWQVGKHYGKVSPGATFAADSSVAHGGSRSLKITSVDDKIPAIFMTDLVDVEAGATYRLSAYIKSEAKSAAVRLLVVPNHFKGVAGSAIKVSDQWQRYDLDFKAATSDVRPVNLRFDLTAPGTIWIDDVTFTKTSKGNGTMSDSGAYLPANDVTDGGFEQSKPGALPDRWEIGRHYGQIPEGATFVVDAAVAHQGKQSVKITSPSDQEIPAILMSNPVAAEPGQTYVITAYLKSEAKSGEAEILALRSDERGVSGRCSLEITNQWRRYRLVFQAAGNAPGYRVRIDAGQGTTWIDDVSLTPLAEADKTGPALGYRYADKPGDKAITLTVGQPTGQTLRNINGVCYAYGFGLKEFPAKWAEANLKVVRLHDVLSNLKILHKQPDGSFTYDYTVLDKAVDEILAVGAVPQINLCFVPVEMVANPDPKLIRGNNRYYRGQPSDYGQWEQYVYNVVKHCSDRYPNVADWFWVFGNEPGVRQFSMGTHEEYYTLYKHTLAGALRANPKIRIGAGSFAHFDWLKDFVERCAADKTRADLITWHHYDVVPEDYTAKIVKVRALLAKHPAFDHATLAIDEWNTILPDNRPISFSSGNYAAAHMTASIYYMMKSGLDYQTHFLACHAADWGGMMSRKGVKQPTFNAAQMLGMLGTDELNLTAPQDEPYVGGFAARRKDGAITVIVWYVKSRNDISPDFDKTITLRLPGVEPSASVTRYLIDRQHSNSQTDPKRENLETVPASLHPDNSGSGAKIEFDASPNSVSLLVIGPNVNKPPASLASTAKPAAQTPEPQIPHTETETQQ